MTPARKKAPAAADFAAALPARRFVRSGLERIKAAGREFVSALAEMRESLPPGRRRRVFKNLCLMLSIAVAWSWFWHVDVVATASGRFIPDRRPKLVDVQQLGSVEAIHVEAGQRVAAGSVLLEIDPTLQGADIDAIIQFLASGNIGKRQPPFPPGFADKTDLYPEDGLLRQAAENRCRGEEAAAAPLFRQPWTGHALCRAAAGLASAGDGGMPLHRRRACTVLAPTAGIVESVRVSTVGEVVAPGDAVLTIVPDQAPLVVEAMLADSDAGLMETGQTVEIRVGAYPSRAYDVLPGRLSWISPEIESGPRGRFRKATIEPLDMPAGVVPGMAVSVDIAAGRRRMLEIFQAPLLRRMREGLFIREESSTSI